MATYFIGDLHLNPPTGAPEADDDPMALFEQFCHTCAEDVEALYILGDLFEVWIGDDAGLTPYQRVIKALTNLPAPIFVLHGNRDFLLDEAFCDASGAQLLADPTAITCGGQKILISHGDALCTDDLDYQRVRSVTRQPAWRDEFLGQSIDQRVKQAAGFRQQSQAANREKADEIMDVNESAVTALLEHHQLLTLVHGHTHRPACHTHHPGHGTATRWVVGSWQKNAEILRWDGAGPSLIKLKEYLLDSRSAAR